MKYSPSGDYEQYLAIPDYTALYLRRQYSSFLGKFLLIYELKASPAVLDLNRRFGKYFALDVSVHIRFYFDTFSKIDEGINREFDFYLLVQNTRMFQLFVFIYEFLALDSLRAILISDTMSIY
jgi:hypothetical protein